MMTVTVQEKAADLAPNDGDALAQLVDSIGHDGFGRALAGYLHRLCGADHFAAFRLGHGRLAELAAGCIDTEHLARDRVESYVNQGLWKNDPAMSEAQRRADDPAPALIRVDFSDRCYIDLRPRVYPHVRDRVLLCGRSAAGMFGLSVLRAEMNTPFAAGAIEHLGRSAAMLVSVLGKHAEVCDGRPNVAGALTVLVDVENCVVAMSELPRREAEVCARILYGLSSVGIALDLGVSEETVKTYRKRAYHRLAIGSERELLTWYLARWSRWHAERPSEWATAPLH